MQLLKRQGSALSRYAEEISDLARQLTDDGAENYRRLHALAERMRQDDPMRSVSNGRATNHRG